MHQRLLILLFVFVCAMAPPRASAQPMTVEHYAGAPGCGSEDGRPEAARFHLPMGVAVDGAGVTYVADTDNHVIRRIEPDGATSTMAGQAGVPGSEDGPGNVARFRFPLGIALGPTGDLFVSDSQNRTIRQITPEGMVSTLAGSPETPGSVDGRGPDARFCFPWGVAFAPDGFLYVVDAGSQAIRRISRDGVVATVHRASNPRSCVLGPDLDQYRRDYYREGISGIAVTPAGRILVSDGHGNAVLELEADGSLEMQVDLPGNAELGTVGLAARGDGSIVACDAEQSVVWEVDADGTVSLFAGSPGEEGRRNGTRAEARFTRPMGIATSALDVCVIADTYGNAIRKVEGDLVTTLAGPLGGPGSNHDDDLDSAEFVFFPALAPATDGGLLVTASTAVREITPDGRVVTIAGSLTESGHLDGTGLDARFEGLSGIGVDLDGNILVSDSGSYTIRMISTSGEVSTLAGLPYESGSRDGTGAEARFLRLGGLVIDSAGDVIVLDDVAIRRISRTGLVTTIAGRIDDPGYIDGPALEARFGSPAGLGFDLNGDLLVVEHHASTIRRLSRNGIVTTIVGRPFDEGDQDGPVGVGRLNWPIGMTVDRDGNAFVTQWWVGTIRKVDPTGFVTTVAGVPTPSDCPRDGTGPEAQLLGLSIGMGGDGRIYFSDMLSGGIRRLSPSIATIAVIDASRGRVGEARQLTSIPAAAERFEWSIVLRPPASGASFDAPESAAPRFVPDRPGAYQFRLVASSSVGSRISVVDFEAVAPVVASFDLLPAVACAECPVRFFDRSVGPATSWLWDFGDGEESGERDPVHSYRAAGSYVVTLVARNELSEGRTTRRVEIVEPSFAPVFLVPGVAHSTGRGGSFFTASLLLTNVSSEESLVRVTYRSALGIGDGGARSSKTVVLAPSRPARLDDLLGTALGATRNTHGLILLEVAEGKTIPVVDAEIANRLPDGRVVRGELPVIRLGDRDPHDALVPGLAGTAAFRTNLGLVNLDSAERRVVAELLDAAGESVGTKLEYDLPPLSVLQVPRVNESAKAGALDPFAVRVRSDGPVFAYASVLDETTSDPAVIPGDLAPRSRQWIENVFGSHGEGTLLFKTRLSLTNAAAAASVVRIGFTMYRDGRPFKVIDVPLGPGETKKWDDFVHDGLGIGDAAGWISIESNPEAPVIAWARFYADFGPGGTIGGLIPAWGEEDLAGAGGQVVRGLDYSGWNGPTRVDFGITNVTDGKVSFCQAFWNDEGEPIGPYYCGKGAWVTGTSALLYERYGFPGPFVTKGSMMVSPETPGALHFWASEVDRVSGDRMFHGGVRLVESRAGRPAR
jgi:PKD repeat protein/sugar lactone lactonase YvrE